MGVYVNVDGPLFDWATGMVIEDIVTEVSREVAAAGEDLVQVELAQNLKNPTPVYQTRINSEPIDSNTTEVNDGDMIYGPWLEGTGSRNKTTRFKGYASFRKAETALQRVAKAIADDVVNRNLGRLG